MFSCIIRPIIRYPRYFTSIRHKSQNIIPDIKDPVFWEEESRPIPNSGDAVLHVVTQENQHINWERSHEKLVLIGEVAVAATKMPMGMGRAAQFMLKTTTIIEETVGYKVLEQFHYLFVMQETLRHKVLRTFLPGTPMMVFAGIHYRLREDKDDICIKFMPILFLESYTLLDERPFN